MVQLGLVGTEHFTAVQVATYSLHLHLQQLINSDSDHHEFFLLFLIFID